MKRINYLIQKTLIFLNIILFGLGSFLCFIVAVIDMQDRLLIGGVLLLLLTFANQKIIYYIFKNND
ncbi:MAG: hypothetical protein CMP24_05370 [Rickettsiales bacterium]|nr:hypothetical protein [Rickettsiales bacterium]|tara:strand:- start:257 stop:454 length:198 start_codon:yes stop_codon:yes gene_type:complete